MKVIALSILCSLVPLTVTSLPYTWYEVKDVGLSRQYVHSLVIILADQYEVEGQAALRIAQCESDFRHTVDNSNSSASGVYQFIDSTWEHYCEGDVYNARDNITCFMELYPQHPEWWECK